MTRRSWVAYGDGWDDDDPAVARVRDAERDFAERLTAPPSAPPNVAGDDIRPPQSKHERIAQLVARIRAGDLSAVAILRNLVDSRDSKGGESD